MQKKLSKMTMTKEEFIDWFNNAPKIINDVDGTEYPSKNQIFGLTEYPEDRLFDGYGFDYVSNSFLNGMVNYTDEMLIGYMIRRYTQPKDYEQEMYRIKELEDFEKRNTGILRIRGLEGEAFDEWEKGCRYIDGLKNEVHTDLSRCPDDVFLLGVLRHNDTFPERITGDVYVYFWYDRDVSDCSIGMTSKYKSDEEAIDALFADCLDTLMNSGTYDLHISTLADLLYEEKVPLNHFIYEIPRESITGWLKG